MALLTPESVFRRYETMGVPESGPHDPEKAEIIGLLNQMMASASAPAVVRQTKAALDAVTPLEETYGGMVLNDPDPTKNGYYSRASGIWVKGRGFPDTFAALTAIGGTANAITAATEAGVNPADILVIMLPDPPGTNLAGAVTIALNGGTPEPVYAAAGGLLAAGDIIDGVGTMFFRSGAGWRQLFSSRTGATFDHQGLWDVGKTYTEGQVVYGSDEVWYQLKDPSSTGDDPVGSVTGAWLKIFEAVAIADGSVTNAKLANMAAARIKGRAFGSGTGAPTDLTPDQVRQFTVPRGHYFGLTLAPSVVGPGNNVDIAQGEAASDQAPYILMTYAGATGVQLDVAYGTGSGGRFDSALSDGTWFVFIISDGATVSRGLSKSLNPTGQLNYPSGYNYYRRIGAVVREGGVNLPWIQSGNTWLLTTPVNTIAANNPGTSAVLAAMKVPSGIQVTALGWVYLQAAETARRAVAITSPDQSAVTPAAGTMSTFVAGSSTVSGNASGEIRTRTNTSSQVRYQLDGSSANTSLFITTSGWIDEI